MNEEIRTRIMDLFEEEKELSITDISDRSDFSLDDIKKELNLMERQQLIKKLGRRKYIPLFSLSSDKNPLIPKSEIYFDWNDVVSKLKHCYTHKINTLLIGPKGVGKTAAIRKVAELVGKPLRTVNFSLRTREHHFVGRLDTDENGNLYFKEGPLIKSMRDGGILYLDEINVAESSVLIRLDEALDYRREINVEGQTIKADKDWWVVGSINPLDRYHTGTRELPGQLISRYPARIYMSYPDSSVEYKIVKMHIPEISKDASRFMKLLFSIEQLRNTDLPYIPSVRESIALAKLLVSGVNEKTAVKMTLIDVYYQFGSEVAQSVTELLHSRGIDVEN